MDVDGSASPDRDGQVVDERWDWESADHSEAGPFADHRYDTSGTYEVTLTAEDDDATAEDSITVTVEQSCHSRNPDCDGKFEDSDGDMDMDDVRELFDKLDQYGSDSRFDLDGDTDDVQALYSEVR